MNAAAYHRPGQGKRERARHFSYRHFGRAPESCGYCGSNENVQWHHEDHGYPYLVLPLCRTCNFRRDDNLGRWPELVEWCKRRFAGLLKDNGEQLPLLEEEK